MKYKSFKSIIALSIFGVFCAIFCQGLFATRQNVLAENVNYYYSQLQTELSKNFYNAISSMEKDGILKQGNMEYDLIANNVLTDALISSYSEGNTQLLKEFGAGRDAYVLDNADNFYTDFTKLSISIGMKDGKFVATLGTGRTDNYYIDNTLSSDKITQEKQVLANKVTSLLADAQNKTDLEKIELANKTVSSLTTYSFCNDDITKAYAPYIRTAYGSLVNGYAVCEGYARALKLLLDELNIKNVLVYGYLLSSEGGLEPHMWNYCQLENKWYAVDATLNSSNSEKYCFLQGENEFSYDHIEQGVISEADYKFSYPVLSTYSYGKEVLPTAIEYKGSGDNKLLYVTLSYNGKNATDLAQDNLYLAYCYSTQTSTEDNIEWSKFAQVKKVMELGLASEAIEEGENYIVFKDWGSCPFVKFAVINKNTTDSMGYYTTISPEDIVCQSDIITNQIYDGYVASPFANWVSPANTAKMDINKSYHIVLKYDEQLVKTNNEDVDVEVISTHGATKEQYSLTNIRFNEETNELSFDFKPSKMFIHNGDGYNFTPTNLVGSKSNKRPHAVSYSFQYTSIICNKILDDGRLYMDVYAHPKLVDNSDLSMQNWTLNGVQVGQNQRSQLALVITKPSESDNQAINSSIADKTNLEQKDILSTSTFELDLDLCGCVTRVPNGSYMKVSFGFPEGYSAKDKGVTFKLFHFKRDASGNIDPSKTEEITCVITEYGLVAEINDFSPFAVVAVKASGENNVKAVYSRTIGAGGSVKLQGSSKNIATLSSGSVTYDLVADEGYEVNYVILNQKQITVENNKVTLNYEELSNNNVLEVSFASSRVLEHEEQNGIVNLQKDFSINLNQSSNSLVAPFVISLGIIIALCACTGVIYFIIRKKRQTK